MLRRAVHYLVRRRRWRCRCRSGRPEGELHRTLARGTAGGCVGDGPYFVAVRNLRIGLDINLPLVVHHIREGGPEPARRLWAYQNNHAVGVFIGVAPYFDLST